MNPLGWLTLVGAGLCGAAASVVLKIAASQMPPISPRILIIAGIALTFYGASFVLYGYSLRFLNVGVAYVSMVAVAVLALLLYTAARGEIPSGRELLGVVVVLAGVILISWKPAG